MRHHLLTAFCALSLIVLAEPLQATIVVFGHHQGLSGTTTARPGDQVPVYSVRLVNDGTTTLDAISLTLSDLSAPTGINADAIDRLQLYYSADASLDAGQDSLLGTQTAVTLDTPTTVSLDTPLSWSSGFPYIFVAASIATGQTDEAGASKNAFRVAADVGSIQTSDGAIGSAIAASDDNRVTIDVVATQIAFATLPADGTAIDGDVVNGQIFATQPVLEARDSFGNVDIEHSGTLALSVQSGAVTLSGTNALSWSSGRAAFTDLAVSGLTDGAGFVLSASDGSLVQATTPSLKNDAVATQIAFSTPPADPTALHGDIVSGKSFATQPVLEARDSSGIRDLNASGTVTLALISDGSTLSGTTTRSWISGRTDFAGSGLSILVPEDGTSFSLKALSGDLAGQSASLIADVLATQIQFDTLPADPTALNGDVVSGKTFDTQPTLRAVDARGITDTDYQNGNAALALATGNATLGGTLSRPWNQGQVSFSDLNAMATVDGQTFTLQATDDALLPDTSATLTVDVLAAQIQFDTLPADPTALNGDVVSGKIFNTQPILRAVDTRGITDTDYQNGNATLALATGNATLGGTLSRPWNQGQATFSDLGATATADGQTFSLRATDDALLPDTSATLTVDVLATQIQFDTLPADPTALNGDIVSGKPFDTQPVLRAVDTRGITDTDYQNGNATLALADGDATLGGTLSRPWSQGQATFSDLGATATVDGQTFSLLATDGALLPDTSATLTVDILAAQIQFDTLPADPTALNGDIVSGKPFDTQPVLRAVDTRGITDTDYQNGNATLALATGNATLGGTLSRPWNQGLATFTDLRATASADGQTFTLQAAGDALLPDTSATLTVDVLAAQIQFDTLPADPTALNGDIVSGKPFDTQPVLRAVDTRGITDTDYQNGNATLALADGDATLSGTLSRPWSQGQATFSDLGATATVDGQTFTLLAADDALLPDTSATLTVDVLATQIQFDTLPADPTALHGDIVSEKPFDTQPVLRAVDSRGITDSDYQNGNATLALADGDALLGGTLSRPWNQGQATFSDLRATASADGAAISLRASADALLPDTSSTLTVDVVAAQIEFATLPADPAAINGDVVNGKIFATQPVLEARDAYGIRDSDYSIDSVVVVATGVELVGESRVPWQSGRAVFSALTATGSADETPFTLSASDGSLSPAISTRLILDAVATTLSIATLPDHPDVPHGDLVSGIPFQQQPVVRAHDDRGVLDLHFVDRVTLSATPGTLRGTTTIQAVAGVATFADLAYEADTDGVSFRLTADDEIGGDEGDLPTTTAPDSLLADVVATTIGFAASPRDISAQNGDIVNGRIFPTQPVLEARDGRGVRDVHFNAGSVSIAVSSGDVVLEGTSSQPWSGGRANFSDLAAIETADSTPFVLTADSDGLEAASSDTLILDAMATRIGFAVLPADPAAVNGDVVNGKLFATQPALEAWDLQGVRDLDFDTASLELRVQSGAVELVGETRVPWQSGRAVFSALTATSSTDETSFTLSASDGSLSPAVSTQLILDAVATTLSIATLPDHPDVPHGDIISGIPFQQQPVVRALDDRGVLDLHFVDRVTLSATPGTLRGTTTIQAIAGIATFADLAYDADTDGVSFRLTVDDETGGDEGDLPTTAAPDPLVADVVATRMTFDALPHDPNAPNGDIVSGKTFATQPRIRAVDERNIPDTHYDGDPVTLAIETGDVTLRGTTSIDWNRGIAQFTDLAIDTDTDQQHFSLKAQASDLAELLSDPLVADVVATRMTFDALPRDPDTPNGDIVSGKTFATQPRIRAVDERDIPDVQFDGDPVTLAIDTGDVTLRGTTSIDWNRGIAQFTDLAIDIDTDQQHFSLKAQASDLADLLSDPLIADVVATRMTFDTLPHDPDAPNGDIVSGKTFATQPRIRAVDESSVLDTDFADRLTLSATPDSLKGTTTARAISGVASFTGLSYSASTDGIPFSLSVDDESGGSEGDLPAAIAPASLTADVVATRMVFADQPGHTGLPQGTVVHALPFAIQPVLEARDEAGVYDRDLRDGGVLFSILSGDASTIGATGVKWSAGRADFASSGLGLVVGKDGERVVLKAESDSGFPPLSSDTLTVDIRATRLVFIQEPRTEATAGADLADPDIVVSAIHSDGQTDRNFDDDVELIAVFPGTNSPTIDPLQVSPAPALKPGEGRATFTSATYPHPGSIQLMAFSAGLESARSDTIHLSGHLALAAPDRQIENRLTHLRGTVPAQRPLLAFRAEAIDETLILRQAAVSLELDAGMQIGHLAALQIWRDRGEIGELDRDDRLLAEALPFSSRISLSLADTLRGIGRYLVTWSGSTPLQEGWEIRARILPENLVAGSTRAPEIGRVAVLGESVDGALHTVGRLGAPSRVRLSAEPDTLSADSLSRARITAVLVDDRGQTTIYDSSSSITFSTLTGQVLIDGPVTVRVDGGEATTSLLAGTEPGRARIRAHVPGLIADTLEVVVTADSVAAIELEASPATLHLEREEQVELTAVLRDARGNSVAYDAAPVRFSLAGPGLFPGSVQSQIVEILPVDGRARAILQATGAGTLRVEAALKQIVATRTIPVITDRIPRIELSADAPVLPADGTVQVRITASLLDLQDQVLVRDDSTRIRFSLVSGHGLLIEDPPVITVHQGQAQIPIRGLGIAGPIVIRAEVDGFEASEISLNARAAHPHHLDLVALDAELTADGISTTTLSAVLRDSLSNVVADTAMTVDFSIASGQAEIIGPRSVTTANGTARTVLRSSIHAGPVQVCAEASDLILGKVGIELIAGPPAKLLLQAVPPALPVASSALLVATIQDVHGNQVYGDSTTLVSFSISGGPGSIGEPAFARAAAGRVEAALFAGERPGTVLVFAGASGLAPAILEVPVRQAQPPVFAELPEHLLLREDGTALRLPLASLVTDADTELDDLRFSFAPDTLHVDVYIEGGDLVIEPGEPNYAGVQDLRITVRDSTALEASAVIPIVVQPVNDPPVISSIPDTLARADSLYIYRLRATDADGDRLTLSLVEGPPGLGFDRILGRAAWRAPVPGTFLLRFAVDDGQATVEQRFRLHVLLPTSLSIISQPAARARRGHPYIYQVKVDGAGADTVSFTLETGPQGMRIDRRSGLLSWNPGPTAPDSTRVAVIARSAGEEARQEFDLEMIDGNSPPTITSTPTDTTWVDSLYTYRLQAEDAEGDTLVYQILQGADGMRINPISGSLTWRPDATSAERTIAVVLSAYDGQETVTQTYALTVLSRPLLRPPAILPLRGVALDPATRAASLDLDILVEDADHADSELTWTFAQLSGDSLNIDYDPATRHLSFAAGEGFAGAGVRIEVSDPDSLTDAVLLRVAPLQAGDFNRDTAVGLDDFFTLVDAFGTSEGVEEWNARVDLNGDARIDLDDFFLFVDQFNRSNQPDTP